ncbi:hypothetical protein SDC9_28357 [bioreactor metagenome]|uniref:Uncharacterized protein n=2 Tax=root TaxID=1 RepID=A0A212KKR2_9BACT|nr:MULTISPECIES: hypothetical protein [Desulfovibrio]MBD8895005.1 hypothetical protein [Desulfovibrio desulfuricans]MBT9748918.1 hypothetical protein [Desulfovibrio desulfuricans]MCH5144728.1 hypothetical protein [Desulfovibrio sp. UIB00]QTO39147.1 hypothetical protein J8J02_08255 [Desulfovibrio desulfuricans]SBW12306.1 conserved hypothetical protein [uncultured Desulfovibrio sp.]
MIVNIIEFFRARLKATIRVCLVVLAALVVWDALFVSKEHVHTFVERIPGFWAAFGFVACVVIIIVSKWFGHLGIMTREDYYDD